MKNRKSICSALSEDLYQVLSYNDFAEDDQKNRKRGDREQNQTDKRGESSTFFSKVKEKVKSIGKRVFEFLKRHKKKIIIGVSLMVLNTLIGNRMIRKQLTEYGAISPNDSFLVGWKKVGAFLRMVSSGLDPELVARNFEEYAERFGYSFKSTQTESYLRSPYYGKSLKFGLDLFENADEDTFIRVLQMSFRDALKDRLKKSGLSSRDKTDRAVAEVLLQVLDKHPELFNDAFFKAYKGNKAEFDKLKSAISM